MPRVQDMFLCTLFMAFLLAPFVSSTLRREPVAVKMAGSDRIAEFPPLPANALEWASWPRDFEAWHFDHLGLRASMVRAENMLKIIVLGTSPSPRIAIGRDHWIFAAGYDIDAWRGADPFTQPELLAWHKCLGSRKSELAAHGIRYFFVIAPGKAAIYPEFLPARFQKGGPSRTDELVAYLAQNSRFRPIDARAALLKEKRNDVGDDYLYYPLGFHWNARGAWVGTRAIVTELAALWPAVSNVDGRIDSQESATGQGDSWAEALFLSDMLTQPMRQVIFHDAVTRTLKFSAPGQAGMVVVDQEDASLPRAVVLHDSFGDPMPELLGRYFSHAVFVNPPELDTRLLEQEKPDLVIQIVSDRALAKRHYPHDMFVWTPTVR